MMNEFPIKDAHFLYFCNGKAECSMSNNCEFGESIYAQCDRINRIEYALNKEKYKKQILDGIFPVEDDWRYVNGNYVEKLKIASEKH